MKSFTKSLMALVLFFICNNSIAAPNVAILKKSSITKFSESGMLEFVKFKDNEFIGATEIASFLKLLFGLQEGYSFEQLRSSSDKLGMQHVRFIEKYKGLTITQAEVVVHIKNNSIHSINGKVVDNLGLEVFPVISPQQSIESAISAFPNTVFKWNLEEEEAFIKRINNDNKGTYFPKPELLILAPTPGSKQNSFKLAYSMSVYAHEPMFKKQVFIDAENGKLLFEVDQICHANSNASGNTKYSGTQNFVSDSTATNNFRLRETGRASGIETYNMQRTTTYGNAVDFTDTDNIWTNTTNQDDAALDAHWGAEKTFDYFSIVHGRNSFNNAGAKLISYVHYSSNYNNAFWNGSYMTYGDGNGTTFSPLTTLDIVGHEFSHGVTEYASGLIYSYQSGALNESFSDIFGVAIDFYVNGANANWKMGEGCYTPATPNDALRYMNNPNQGGDPDTYLGTNWYTGTGDNGGVHYNSGVQNFWFYLLCNGGTGSNDFGFAYNVPAIGITKAAAIAYRNNEVYLTSGSQYADAGFYSIQAATDLYGPCSPEVLAVKAAWDAVGIYNLSTLPNATASVAASPCIGSNVQLNASGGTAYTWSGPNGFTSNLQNPIISNAVAANNGTYTVVVSDAAGCSGSKSVVLTLNDSPILTSTPSITICPLGAASLTASASINGAGLNSGINQNRFIIPDNNLNGIESSINISGALSASQITSVRIDSLNHTYTGDLRLILVAPNGSQITLADGVGGAGDNFINTTFQIGAGAITSGVAPFSGSYAPVQPFSNLSGTANGTWKLKVIDFASVDTGSLWKWTLTCSPNAIASYIWSPNFNLSNNAVANPTATPNVSTLYSVLATDLNGCQASSNSNVTVDQITTSSAVQDALCHDQPSGGINIQITNSQGSITSYSWSNGTTNQDLSNVSAGSYSLTITNSNNCSIIQTFNINDPDPMLIAPIITQTSCGLNNGAIAINTSGGVAPYTYLWNNSITTNSIDNLSPGNYNVIVTDSNSCLSSQSFSINASSALLANLSSLPTSCGGNNGSASAVITNGLAPYVYLWSNGATTSNIANLATGTYSVSIQDAIGCGFDGTTSVTSSGGFSPTFSASATSVCAGQTVTLTATSGGSGLTYQWLRNNLIVSGATNMSYTFVPSGSANYNLRVNGPCGLATASSQLIISNSLPTALQATITSNGSTTLCNGSSLLLSAPVVAGFTYQWQRNSVNLVGSTNNSLNVSSAGSYRLFVYNSAGCLRVSNVIAVTVVNNITSLISASGPLTFCQGGSVNLNASPNGAGYNFQWKLNGTNISGATSVSYLATISGNYSCQVSIGSCSSNSNTLIVNAGTALVPSLNYSYAFICNLNPVNLLTTNYGSGYSYQWMLDGANISGATNANYSAASPGSYSVAVASTGCNGVSPTAIIQEGNVPTATFSTTGNSVCAGTAVTLSASPQGNGLMYQWSRNGAPLSGVTNATYTFAAGSSYPYSVTVSNNCGASTATPQNITVNPIPTASISANGPTSFCIGGNVQLQTSSNIIGVSYQWQRNSISIPGATAQTYLATIAGSYRCIVTSPASCTRVSNALSITINCRTHSPSQNDFESAIVFPNPILSSGNLNIAFVSNANEMIELLFTDILGRQILNKNVLASIGQNNFEVNLPEIPSGTYLLKVNSSSNLQVFRIFVVN